MEWLLLLADRGLFGNRRPNQTKAVRRHRTRPVPSTTTLLVGCTVLRLCGRMGLLRL
jgi:hypothetical protein